MNTEPPNSVVNREPSDSAPSQAPRPKAGGQTGWLSELKARLDWRIGIVLLLAVSAVPIWRALKSPAKETAPSVLAGSAVALPVVPVARVVREDLYNEKPIPADFRPYEEVELHAKVSGYVKEINVDFGDRVKAGQLLATLEVPELHDELNRALAALQRAEADYKDANLIYSRLVAVDKDHPNLVAQQELDSAEARDRTTEATIAASKAEVERYQTLLAYTRITAPFDGVVTYRYVDKGALIQAGTTSDTQSLPLVRVSDNYRLRLDIPVSVDNVKDIHVGDKVEVRVGSLGGKTFTGTITRSTQRVNMDTRTMITEVEVPNPTLELVPGMYARVLLKVEQRPQALAIPMESMPAGQTKSVYVINDQGTVEEPPVSLGMDTPNLYEVTGGLKEGELVLLGSRSQVHPGEKVEPKLIGALAQQ